jgi:hypothetical protein
MSARVAPALPAAAAIAAFLSFSFSVLSPSTAANAAETCITAPTGPAPQGSRWQYRTERPAMRKCWRLVRKDGKEQVAVRKPAQAEPDEEADETASVPNAPTQPTQVRTEIVKPSPATENWTTRNLSGADNTPQPSLLTAPQPSLPISPPADATQPVENLREQTVAQATADEPAAAAPVVAPPVAAAPAPEASSAPTLQPTLQQTWHMLLWAVGLLGVLGGAVLLAIEIAMRRTDVLNTVRDAKRHGPVPSPKEARVRAPTFAPLPPMAPVPHEDDVDQALRRFARSR